MMRTNLGRTENEHRPARLDNGAARACGLLNLLDLLQCPFHRRGEIEVDVFEVLDEADLVAVSPVRK